MEKRNFLIQDLRAQGGADEHARLYTITSVATGKTDVVVEKTIIERYPVQEIAKAEDLYERLTCASGRRVFALEEIAHPFNPGEGFK